MSKNNSTQNLEQEIKQLEAVISKLEDNQLPLDKLLVEFEKGVKLVRNCQTMLNNAQQKIQQLTEANGANKTN